MGVSVSFFTLMGVIESVLDSFDIKLSILKELFKFLLKLFKDDMLYKLPIVGQSTNITDNTLNTSRHKIVLLTKQTEHTDNTLNSTTDSVGNTTDNSSNPTSNSIGNTTDNSSNPTTDSVGNTNKNLPLLPNSMTDDEYTKLNFEIDELADQLEEIKEGKLEKEECSDDNSSYTAEDNKKEDEITYEYDKRLIKYLTERDIRDHNKKIVEKAERAERLDKLIAKAKQD